MKRTSLALMTTALIAVTSAQAAVKLSTEAQKVGYAIGVDMGSSLNQLNNGDSNAIDFNALIIGLRDAYQGQELAMTTEEATTTLQTFAQARMEKMQKELADAAQQEKVKGAEFLKENAAKDGVTVTDSGLQYSVITKGDGAKPGPDDTVTVDYEGRLIDGTVFDSSAQHGGQPVTFNVQDVIAGWVEGLQLMPEGSKYTFYIPSELAYGEMGAGPTIPPNAVLIFDIELHKVEPVAQVEEMAAAAEAVEAADTVAVAEAVEATADAGAVPQSAEVVVEEAVSPDAAGEVPPAQ